MEIGHSIELHNALAFFFSIKERLPTDNTSKASGMYEYSLTIYGNKKNITEAFKLAHDILKEQEALGIIPTSVERRIPEEFEGYSIKNKKE